MNKPTHRIFRKSIPVYPKNRDEIAKKLQERNRVTQRFGIQDGTRLTIDLAGYYDYYRKINRHDPPNISRIGIADGIPKLDTEGEYCVWVDCDWYCYIPLRFLTVDKDVSGE